MQARHNCSNVSRREFLIGTAAAFATAGSARCLLAAAPDKTAKKVVVGAHPWVYAATQPNCDITPVLPMIFADMQYAGMDGIELMHTALRPTDAVERIAALSEEHKLPIIGASFAGEMWDRKQHQAVFEDAELVITRLAKLGGRTLGTSVGTPLPQKKTPQQLDDQAELLRKIIALGKAHGVTLNLHNHTYEVLDNLYDLKGTLARIPDVKLGPDINWLIRGGVDPIDFIHRYGRSIVFLHIRDQKADGRWSEALGEGATDYGRIARALGEAGFQGDAVIELAHESNFQPTRPLRESLRISRAYVRRVMDY
jgi:sugar phosphate isomerase/epimerase